jgi:hypothetical protein
VKGDFSRDTFRPDRHYGAVRLQQGRVLTDADWNEQSDIVSDAIETALRDLIGAHGGPAGSAGFAVQPAGAGRRGDFVVGAGRYYVDGIRCENPAPVEYRSQPHLPDPPPAGPGRSVVYLDVWRREVTSVQDPELADPALGGTDTATRLQTVWQVRVLPVAGAGGGFECRVEELPEWGDLTAGPRSLMSARAEPSGGYRGIENHLYRVEIHEGGEGGSALFTWSRDNGSVVFPIAAVKGATVTVSGLDRGRGLGPGDWVEATDDPTELWGRAGVLLEVVSVDVATDTVVVSAEPPVSRDPSQHPLLRRWDERTPAGALLVEEGRWIELEDGLELRFGPGGSYRTGDHWLIPARPATRDVEWPKDDDTPVPRPPRRIAHRYCPLALLEWRDGRIAGHVDCRRLFAPLPERGARRRSTLAALWEELARWIGRTGVPTQR